MSLGGPAYVDVDGRHITDNFPELLPTGGLNDSFGLTIAAWVNVPSNSGSDHSVFQARVSSGRFGTPHFQLQGDGRLRMTLRSQAGNTVVHSSVFVDGSEDNGNAYPVDEWFHYAGTYDRDENAWAMYYNGMAIATGTGTGEDLGDWGGIEGDLFAAGIGATPDAGSRRFDGLMDELYVFNRALTPQKVCVLSNVPEPSGLVRLIVGFGGLIGIRQKKS